MMGNLFRAPLVPTEMGFTAVSRETVDRGSRPRNLTFKKEPEGSF